MLVTIFIYHKQNNKNFRVLLTLLQPSMSPDDDLYVYDTSKNREGVMIARLYGTTRSYIFVEVGNYSLHTAYKFAYQNMVENKQDGLLLIDENCIISSTLIANLKKNNNFGIVTPVVIQTPYPAMPSDFKWYNNQDIVETKDYSEFCYFIKKDGGDKIGLLANETVILLPNENIV